MLVDDILADRRLEAGYPGFFRMKDRLQKAHKYALASDFTAAADGLVNNVEQLVRIVPFCRLPAPICWFELAQADRPHFMQAPMHYAAFQSAPKRIGFLCFTPDDAKPWEWHTILMWSLVRPPSTHHPNNVSIIVASFNTKEPYPNQPPDPDGLSHYVQVGLASFCPPEAAALLAREILDAGGTAFARNSEFMKIMQSDWGGEIRYVLAMLGLLNARNVVEVEAVERTKLNRARVKGGKPPLCEHTLLKIRAMHRRSLIGARGKGTAGDVREHFVSGHWKTRRTGLFWWNPFWRGNPERGRVDHDYEVTT